MELVVAEDGSIPVTQLSSLDLATKDASSR